MIRGHKFFSREKKSMIEHSISVQKTIPSSSKNFSNISDRYSSLEDVNPLSSDKENFALTTILDSANDDVHEKKNLYNNIKNS